MATQLHDRPALDTAQPTRQALRHGAWRQSERGAGLRSTAIRVERPNIALAGLELLIGYEFLLSGGDKLLYGAFPDTLGALLRGQLGGGHLPGAFAALLRVLVLPNAYLFGWLIELGEVLAGLGLLAAGLFALIRPLCEARMHGKWWRLFAATDRLVARAAPFAALGAGLLGLSFYLLDGTPTILPAPSVAYGGALDTGLFLAAGCAVVLAARWAEHRAGQSLEQKRLSRRGR
jgi:hypothetical protein